MGLFMPTGGGGRFSISTGQNNGRGEEFRERERERILTDARVEIVLDPRTVDVGHDLELLDIGHHADHLDALRRQALELHHACDLCALGRDHAEFLGAVFADHIERELERLERH